MKCHNGKPHFNKEKTGITRAILLASNHLADNEINKIMKVH